MKYSKQIFTPNSCTTLRLLFLTLFFLSKASHSCQSDTVKIEQVTAQMARISLNDKDGYYSDSEDEEGYAYPAFLPCAIGREKTGKECILVARGIHFSPSKFSHEEISHMRRTNDAGEDIFSSAAYDLADEPLGSTRNKHTVRAKAVTVRSRIKKLSCNARNQFQQWYSNYYDGFHQKLGTDQEDGIFKQFTSKKNLQVSTAEDFLHATKYASGFKSLGKNIKSLDPEYDLSGKPKHPYLGKLFVILLTTEQIKEFDPYFVVHGHANDNISISTHWSKNVLSEREVSFPGLVPGDCVVFSTPIRVPSFKGDYKPEYEEKFGISKRSYGIRKKKLTTKERDPETVEKTVKSLMIDVIFPHVVTKIKEHIEKECKAQNIRLVYKQFNGAFSNMLPSIVNATAYKNA